MGELQFHHCRRLTSRAAGWVAFVSWAVMSLFGALPEEIRFQQISITEGLSQNVVRCLVQDSHGYLWFGTEDGLNRYDGYGFTIFRHNPTDPRSLGDNFIWALCRDGGGNLWIGTNAGGLARFDAGRGRFTVYRHTSSDPASLSDDNVRALCPDGTGGIWVGTQRGGLCRYDPRQGRFHRFRHVPDDPYSLASDTILSLCRSGDGTLWIGTPSGLDRWDAGSGRFVHFRHDPAVPASLHHDTVNALCEDRDGGLWVGTENGLHRLDRFTGRFSAFHHDPGDPTSLPHSNILSLYTDHGGRLWVGTVGGLALLDRSTGRCRRFHSDAYRPGALRNDMIFGMGEDSGGTLWIGTSNGIHRYNPLNHRFGHLGSDPNDPASLAAPTVRALLADHAGRLWVGLVQGGLNRVDPATGASVHFKSVPGDPGSLAHDTVCALLEDRQGALWVGTWGGGLDRMDRARTAFTHFRSIAGDPATLSSNIVQALLEDRGGKLWVGTENGLNRMDPATGRCRRFFHNPDDPGSLSDNRIQSGALCFDRSGTLWVGTWNGLNRLDPVSGECVRHFHDPADPRSLSDNRVTGLRLDRGGRLWVATYGGGVNRLDASGRGFGRFGPREGLSGDVVYAILEDADGRLWMSTNHGLSRFNPGRRSFRNFVAGDGLQSNQFFWGAACAAPGGLLCFGGINGLNLFDPRSIRDNTHVPPVVLTAFKKFDRPVDFGQPLDRMRVIPLEHDENFFSLEFAALDFTDPPRNLYAYKLEGFDQDWVYCGTRRYASYTNLEGGDYTFRVKAANNDGLWDQQGLAVHIRIQPPFWAAWWFRLLGGCVLLGGLFLGYRWWMRRLLGREQVMAQLVAERTRELEEKNRALAVRQEELETIDKIVTSINTGIHFKDVLHAIVCATAVLPGAERASFLVLDTEAGVFRFQALRGWPEGKRQKKLVPPEEADRRFIQTAREIFPDIFLAQAKDGEPPSDADTLGGRIRSRLTLRILVRQRVEGFLLLENQRDPAAFAHADILMLRNLKEHIQAAFIKARILEELRVLNEKKNEFLGLAAHDLRNPLGAMINRIGLLQRQVREGRLAAGGIDDLERLLRAAEQMQAMINELLDLSAIESGRLTLCRQPESVAALLLESGALYQRIAEQKNIRLEVDPGRDLPPVPMDKARLLAVMDNLLSNAIKFTYPGGSIRAWPEVAAREVQIHVSDTGQGLDAADLKDVFTGFKKLSARPTGGESSTGLGLAIVKKIVEAHGGTVRVQSRKGEGSTFSFSLPRMEEKCGDCQTRTPECATKQ